ncbi:hypothetical protein EI555_009982 [Monodon monoceros]|uniref:Uncharacterized protein n=1 Tax=Monodon monoceros TaxID=40151 RepID=A0A4U1FQA7_MONMO|nr:hypothetical protein EI555_009982 [Monodon monoceros]
MLLLMEPGLLIVVQASSSSDKWCFEELERERMQSGPQRALDEELHFKMTIMMISMFIEDIQLSRGQERSVLVLIPHIKQRQIILVATPSVMYLGYAIHKVAKMEHGEADKKAHRSKPYAMHWKQHQALEET